MLVRSRRSCTPADPAWSASRLYRAPGWCVYRGNSSRRKWTASFRGRDIVLPYVGFETKGTDREYTFGLRGSGGESADYIVTIANDAFLAHRVRYQDAPDICSLRVHREFAAKTRHPSYTRFCFTDAKLTEYKDAHAPKSKPSIATPREDGLR